MAGLPDSPQTPRQDFFGLKYRSNSELATTETELIATDVATRTGHAGKTGKALTFIEQK
jgi:hypothetical protein